MEQQPSRIVTFRTAFLSGLLTLAPLVVTVWAFRKVIDMVGGSFRDFFLWFVSQDLRERPSLSLLWDVLVTIIVVVLVTLLGYLSRYVFAKYFLGVGERFIESIPGVSAVYRTVKQIVDTFSSQNRNLFNKVVLVEYPRKGSWSIGFLTSKVQGEAQEKTAGDVWTVFVPTSPNPTSGFLLMVPQSEIVELEMSVGDGMKMVISGGAVIPPWPAVKAAETHR